MATIRRAFTAAQRILRPTQHSPAAYLCPRNRFYATDSSDGGGGSSSNNSNRNDNVTTNSNNNNSPSDTESPPTQGSELMTSSNAVIPSPSGSPSHLPDGIPLPGAQAAANAEGDSFPVLEPINDFVNITPAFSFLSGAGQSSTLTGSFNSRSVLSDIGSDSSSSSASAYTPGRIIEDNQYHLHIYTHKHNTHMTFSKPNKDSIISLSCGNVGFKKSGRSTFDAAYTLASTVFARIEEKRIQPKSVELVLRGFGPGREACLKALMGREGRYLRPVIERVTDATRLKFGGVRSKGKRRL